MTPETDKELLELAAKAAGMKYPAHMERGGSVGINQGPMMPLWNPLTDDGDALRLAVKLEFRVEIHHDAAQPLPWIRVVDRNCRWEHIGPDEFADDPYAATRRAIVRAAAEVGRRMK